MAATYYLANRLLNHVLGISPFTPPHPLYLALGTQLTAQPDGTWPDELQGMGYRRVPLCKVTPVGALMNAGVTNAHWIRFPTATEDWGDLPCYAIYDAPEGGNMYLCGSTNDADYTDFRYPSCGAGNWVSIAPGGLYLGYWSAENTDDPNPYELGAWIGQNVLDMVFNGTPFGMPASLWAYIVPSPGDGYAPVNVTGYFSAVTTDDVQGMSQNAEIDFPVALDDWTSGTLRIYDGDGHCLFTENDFWGPTNPVKKGDVGVVPSGAITLYAYAAGP